MANSNELPDPLSVEGYLLSLEPAQDFQPDLGRGRARLLARQAAHTRRGSGHTRRLWTAAAWAILLMAVVLPWPRAAAQRLWDEFLVERVTFVEVSDGALPESVIGAFQFTEFNGQGMIRVSDLEAATTEAGFRPSLPVGNVLSGSPELSVAVRVKLSTGAVGATEVQRALDRRGAQDIRVPSEWEGVRLAFEVGPIVIAQYPEATVLQTSPVRMTTPAGFQYDRFMEAGFRLFGRSAEEARALGRAYAANPALVITTPPSTVVDMREVTLEAGRGVLVKEDDVSRDLGLFWMLRGRIYAVTGDITEELAVAVANAIQ